MDIEANRKSIKYDKNEQIMRLLWMLGQILFRFSFRNMFGWRRFVLRMFGATVGHHVNIYNTAVVYMPWNFEIGDYAGIGEHALIYNLGKVKIGCHATVSQRAHLCAGSHDYTDSSMPLLKLPITIGDKSWICADAFIGPNVTVGEGAIVGARAVVVKNVNDWDIVAGNPATFIRKRE